MVEMLDYDATTTPMTLEEVRKAVEGYLGGGRADGSGVDVALIDTGVAPVAGLDGDKVLHGPDLSFEGSTPEVAYLDTYGHGTHMAGIIAGDRAGHEGIAPGARIISLKTAGHDGVTTVPQVIAAIDWVIEHRNSDGLNIRVLNLSLGQRGVDNHVGDHLSAAVERAWDAGIFVVVAAGNRGESQKHLDSPAIDPYVLAVGAHDLYAETVTATEMAPVKTTRTLTAVTSDTSRTLRAIRMVEQRGGVPSWSANGDGNRNPDMIAAGRSIASYRVPGSTIDHQAPAARYGDDLLLGSGTSQSAAVASGMAALLLQAHPSLTPDQVKATVTRTAADLSVPAERDGNGVLRGYRAGSVLDIKNADQRHPAAAGRGSGIVLPSGATWSGGSWSGASWSGATWSGATWSGDGWQ
jgi:serine protease AprX